MLLTFQFKPTCITKDISIDGKIHLRCSIWNVSRFADASMRQITRPTLAQIMDCYVPLEIPYEYRPLEHLEQCINFYKKKCARKCRLKKYLTFCQSILSIIGSDIISCFSPDQHQAIIWTNAGILSIGQLGTKSSEMLIEIRTFSVRKMFVKFSSAKSRLFYLDLNIFRTSRTSQIFSHCPQGDMWHSIHHTAVSPSRPLEQSNSRLRWWFRAFIAG